VKREHLTAAEWGKIIEEAAAELTLESMRLLMSLKQILNVSTDGEGSSAQVCPTEVLTELTKSTDRTLYLNLGHIGPYDRELFHKRPDEMRPNVRSAPPLKELLLARTRENTPLFYLLESEWELHTDLRPAVNKYTSTADLIATSVTLRKISVEEVFLLDSSKPMWLGTKLLRRLIAAQEQTADDLARRQRVAIAARERLNGYLVRLDGD